MASTVFRPDIPTSEKGSANGIATLDQSGLVPSNQLPSYVDDVEEYSSTSAFPASGEIGKIYVATDTNKSYRWSGSTYVELSSYAEASQSASGLMSAADKMKLDSVSEGAQVNPSNQTICNLIYPVGSIYMSVNNTSPATLFGGTWSQLKDRFLLGAGDTYTAGNTGGAASQSYTPAGSVGGHTLTVDEIPSHAHGLNSHKHSIGAHSHGLNSHTHTYSKVDSPTGGPSTNTSGSTTLTENQMPTHAHVIRGRSASGSVTGGYGLITGGGDAITEGYGNAVYLSAVCESKGGSAGHTHTLSNHTHTTSTTSTNTGAASGSTANSTAFDSGAASGNTESKGGGGSHTHGFTGTAATINTMPPYLTVYMWKRTA